MRQENAWVKKDFVQSGEQQKVRMAKLSVDEIILPVPMPSNNDRTLIGCLSASALSS